MTKVISIQDKLREKSLAKYEGGFPIFEGKVLSIPAEIIDGDTRLTLVDYLPKGVELPEQNAGMFLTGEVEKYQNKVYEAIDRVVLPFSIEGERILGANVKGYFTEFEGCSFYALENLAEDVSDFAKHFASFAGHSLTHKYEGFRYLVSLD